MVFYQFTNYRGGKNVLRVNKYFVNFMTLYIHYIYNMYKKKKLGSYKKVLKQRRESY